MFHHQFLFCRNRKPVAELTKSKKIYSRSAINLNSTSDDNKAGSNYSNRSSSLYDLDKTDKKHRQREKSSQNRNLHNISEDVSTSENENHVVKHRRHASEIKLKQRRGHSSSSERADPPSSSYRTRQHHSVDSYDEDPNRFVDHERKYRSYVRERQSMSPLRHSYEQEAAPRGGGDYRKPPVGPPKPARSFVRQKEMEKIHDSSGTEGEISQHSVVYLHATTGKNFLDL